MELQSRVRAKLEKLFFEALCKVIDNLSYSGISEEDFSTFETSLKTFFKYDDIKGFVIESLVEKAKETALIIKAIDHRFESFRKLCKLIVQFGDKNTINVFSTYLLSNKLPNHFLALTKEMVLKEISIEDNEKIFLPLIDIDSYDYNIIEKYLIIINKDIFYLVKKLIETCNYPSLNRLIRCLGSFRRFDIFEEQIVPAIIQHYTGDRTHYLNIIAELMFFTNQFNKTMLEDNKHIGPCQDHFSNYVIFNQYSKDEIVKNYVNYLKNNKSFAKFEDDYINNSNSPRIMAYAQMVEFSNKRKILLRLLELKNEKYVVEFIRKFPAYNSLMPML